jgi:hypothetical protein
MPSTRPNFLLWDLIRGGADALFEQHGGRKRSTDFSTGEKLGVRDHLIVVSVRRARSSLKYCLILVDL